MDDVAPGDPLQRGPYKIIPGIAYVLVACLPVLRAGRDRTGRREMDNLVLAIFGLVKSLVSQRNQPVGARFRPISRYAGADGGLVR